MALECTVRWTAFLLLLSLACCEEWYIPNSRMISDVEFKQKIENEKTAIKVVKFFVPNCVYCRYLKNVIDDLKAERKWSFQIYDFNCAWYPALCSRLQIGSYPFTGIFNQQGQLDDQIGGFYPYPVMKQYFQQIEKQTQELKSQNKETTNSLSAQQEQQTALSIETQKVEERPKQIQDNKQVEVEVREQRIQQESKQKVVQTKIQIINSHKENHNGQAHLSGIYQHIFYCICILIGVVYFSSFANKAKFGKQSEGDANNPQTINSFMDKQVEKNMENQRIV